MTHPTRFGAFVPQGWKLEFAGWDPQRAWARANQPRSSDGVTWSPAA